MKTILITGATDGIGLETAKMLAAQGHTLLAHGRNQAKLDAAIGEIQAQPGAGRIEPHLADLARFADIDALAERVGQQNERLDVLINNAGVLKAPDTMTDDGLDLRFVVNALAPYVLTQKLAHLMDSSGRVINVSSAAQAPVDFDALAGRLRLDDMAAYAQSKLAITMWSRAMAEARTDGPSVIAINPGSLLASKMVKDGFGVAGNDLRIGADILTRAALSEEFADANGKYFDNDKGRFASPHADALDQTRRGRLIQTMDDVLGAVSDRAK